MAEIEEKITIKRKKQYGICSKLWCLRCMNCCKADDVSILTSRNRKELSVKLMTKYQNAIQLNPEEIQVLDVLILLYTLDEKSWAYQYLYQCKLISNDESSRNDLEFYIPQLMNYLVFHEEMLNENISQFILTSCIHNFYFAQVVYWTLYSISSIVFNNQVTEFQKVKQYLQNLIKRMVLNHETNYEIKEQDDKITEMISTYGTPQFDQQSMKCLILPEHIQLSKYIPLEQQESYDFMSCINFWNDIISMSDKLKFADPKIISLRADLSLINTRLPANVYIPFVKDQLRQYTILNIVVQETKIFSTKERAPFYICIEVYNVEKEENKHEDKRERKNSEFNVELNMLSDFKNQSNLTISQESNQSQGVSECYEIELSKKEDQKKTNDITLDFEKIGQEIFGEDSNQISERIRQQSPYCHFRSWRLVHLIVKTGDNLKQEQFALQLINQFQMIFQKENLPLKLTTYDIQSLGPSSGIMEMIKDAATIDSLKKKLNSIDKDITLSQFFKKYYTTNLQKAQRNFCSSLAAYSLICYFLQIKDRHNGNILLHKSGKILHIDFGFFISISPGKGLEFEKNVPFKLLSEYIDVLGGTKSELFNLFRKLFFKGFVACQKHQDQILLLVKMMYSGHGYTLPCFSKGEIAIHDLESRFNPPCSNDGEISVFTQNLINQSLDNWRAKWYDKFQYYFQGIFY
ncbi:unnamed protein product [Paramecium pentaurelia]|uniref:1-phosphatidylinositol 4-kinase n=1 Tax=Paramecium pentaurelia TaxID=43138 RepID=A0A8S1W3V3_9CILI|nr:unnamed protein product [Paramecium pentaurelia]